ncbi:MAG TPA: DUF1302 family protein [Verrucomicrobiae bacterium]|nr:DUF1302 family protein [Verrucomicrobiae bacterium]
MSVTARRTASCLLVIGAALAAPNAGAISFELGEELTGTLNSVVVAGAGVRMQDRAVDLVGKGNLNPGVCGGPSAAFQSCQGVIKDQTHPARALSSSPGQAFLNADDGNLNYDRGDLTQGLLKVTQDLNISWRDYGFFAKWLYFYDFVNNDFTEYHPNWITAENRNRVGSTGAANSNSTFDRTYGPGEPVYRQRTDGEVLRQIGTDLQMLDYYVFGAVPIPFTDERMLTFKIGNQAISWGESTALIINSVNQINPVNANNYNRVGSDLSELFIPTGMAAFSMEPFENATIEAFYGYEWRALEIPAPGSYFSFADLGTNNAMDYASISFGGPAEDPDVCGTGAGTNGAPAANSEFDYSNPRSGCGSPTNNPLSGLTNTALTIRREPDREPSDSGQFGVAFKYFADWLNNGTELSFYFLNYHSQLPYVSFYSTVASCARREGNALDLDVTNGSELLLACPDLPTAHPGDPESPSGPRGATSNAVPIDTVRYQVEYPENLKMFGFSFNTTIGDISMQGEVAYRPDMPLQVDLQDLTFHALGPMLTRCHDPDSTSTNGQADSCGSGTGSTASVGQNPAGTDTVYGTSNFDPYPGHTAFPDTFNLAIGAGVGSARSFPSFVGAYRGVAPGETPASSYIRGWEEFDVYQFNLGGTYIQGATDNVIGADQLIWLFEVGAQYVPDLPGTDRLQIETPGTHYHASAGADGSMTGDFAQDCAHTPDCNYSGYNAQSGQLYGDCTAANLAANTGCGDGLRFNPHQEPADGYADSFSAGYAIVSLIRYESVFPGISFAPFTLFQHDVVGTSTDVAAQFVESRKDITFAFEIRYKESFSFTPGYMWFTGAGSYNVQRDRDQAFGYVKYLF